MLSAIVEQLRCPITGQALQLSADGKALVSADGAYRYRVCGQMAMLLPELAESGQVQALPLPEGVA